MSFSVHALASGSSGNATLVTHRHLGYPVSFLIDAGMSAKGLVAALALRGVMPEELEAVVLTHEHTDHAKSAYAFARKYGVPLVANERTLHRVLRNTAGDAHTVTVTTGDHHAIGGLMIQTFPVPHDAVDPVGVNITCGDGFKASLLTDLGYVTTEVRSAIRGADLLICEANHDVHRLHSGPYPAMLKSRILSDRGHLSNEIAVGLMVDHLLDKGPCTIWLAHLSKVNNLPKLALGYARATLRLETRCPFVLDVAARDKPSASWTPMSKALQLSLM